MAIGSQPQYKAAEVSGIAKKIGTELEQLPMETHQAVVSIVAQLFQHRGLAEQRRIEDEKQAKEDARAKREAEMHQAMMKRQAQLDAEKITQTPALGPIEIPTAVGATQQ